MKKARGLQSNLSAKRAVALLSTFFKWTYPNKGSPLSLSINVSIPCDFSKTALSLYFKSASNHKFDPSSTRPINN
jgi:hypothetical protein